MPTRTDAATAHIRRSGRWNTLRELRDQTPMYDAVISEIDGRRIRIGDHWLTDWASCNYLGFDLDPQIMDAMNTEVHRWGTHPSWSRLLGNPGLYPQIEERLTELLGAPDTLVLPTITHIHMSALPILVGEGAVLVEHTAHKTIYDGCVYARAMGGTLHKFDGDDPDNLIDALNATPVGGGRVVCVDGVNSMTGNLPDLATLARICRDHDALLYVDDAHGFGLVGERRTDETSPYGARGNSVVRHAGESYDNIILVGGFSKAYSSLLAFLAVPTWLKNHLKVAAAPYLYSGPSPTASLASVLAGMDVNEARGDLLRADLYRLTRRVLDGVHALGLATPNLDGTPIVELMLAGEESLPMVAQVLWQDGAYVTLAAYPLVPHDRVGFRLQLTAAHTDDQVTELLATLTRLADRGLLRRA